MAYSWYVLHTYSGHENKVKMNLEQRIKSMGMSDRLEKIFVPTQQVTEIKDGKKRVVSKISFPGYVLIKVDLNNDLWYVIRTTPGVMGFVGAGNNPTPLDDEEVENIITGKRPESEEGTKKTVNFTVGDRVKVISGPFSGFSGTVDEIDEEKGKLRLLISIFSRSTPVELDTSQVEKSNE